MLAVEGHTCWRRVHSDRISFLVDGETYFQAVADAIARARRSVLIIGWDVHSRVRLRRDGSADPEADSFGAILNAAAKRNRRLHLHVLEWDFAAIYALEREVLPVFQFGIRTHRRVHFKLDAEHPVGASHHQKIVVVDDALAFCGGLDLTTNRWDTREHRPDDPRRVDPNGRACEPFHDVQMAVSGAAARALGDLARDRWRRATGDALDPPDVENDPWPEWLPVHLEDVTVAVARTDPAWNGRSEVREVEQLYVDMIRAARRTLFVENQYFTSNVVGETIAETLRAPEGPEVVLVLRNKQGGWLEESTMGVLRARLLRRLRAADAHGRLHVYSPYTAPPRRDIRLHAKVMIVDDQALRIGSSNISNRSMGLDTECDLLLEADGDARVTETIAWFRNDLLAEELGTTAEAVADAVRETGSLHGAIERLTGEGRRLEPLSGEVEEWLEKLVPETALLDPERPVSAQELFEQFVPDEPAELVRHPMTRFAGLVLAFLGLAALWRWTPLAEYLDVDRLTALAAPLRASAWGPVAGTAAIALGGLCIVPVTLMIVVAGLLFGPWMGFACALSGAFLSAALGYGVGRVLWRDAVRRLGGKRLNRISRALARRGIISVALVRLVPIAPFAVVNVVAGSTHIRFRDYAIGSLIALTPGTLLLTVFVDRAAVAVREPEPVHFIIAAALLAALLAGSSLLRCWLTRRQEDRGEA